MAFLHMLFFSKLLIAIDIRYNKIRLLFCQKHSKKNMMPNTDMKQAALSSLYGIDNAGTGYQNPAPVLLIVIILL